MKTEIKNLSTEEIAYGLNAMANENVDNILNPYRAKLVGDIMPVIHDWVNLRKPLQNIGADISFVKNADPIIVGSHAQRLELSGAIRQGLRRGPRVSSSSYTAAAGRLVEYAEQYRAENTPENKAD